MAFNKFDNNRVRGERVIYTASAFARQNLIYLQEIGTSEYLEPYLSNRGAMSSFLFFVVKSGSGKLVYHDVTYNLDAGSCVFVCCDQKYSIASDEELWSLAWIHFNGPSMKSIYEKFMERCGGPCFISNDYDTLENQHKLIFKTAGSSSYVQDMELMVQISELLTMIMKQCWKNTSECEVSASEKKWIHVKEYIEKNYTSDISLDKLADSFNINKFYLTRKFKEEYGYTINQWIANLRITHAKELLRFSGYNMTEVSRECGYNDSAYFTRVFKKEVGSSPTDFKKQWQNLNDEKS